MEMDELQKAYSHWLLRTMGANCRSFLHRLDELATPAEIVELAANEKLVELMEVRFKKSAGKLSQSIFEEKHGKGGTNSCKKLSFEEQILHEYRNMSARGIHYLVMDDEQYPQKLRAIPDAPYGLYYAGRLPDEKITSVAIIGTRNCSEYGKYMAKIYGESLAKAGVQIISGMARGVDGIGQSAALAAGGYSMGVFGCGIDICYPPENRQLYEKLLTDGGVISEYSPGTEPRTEYFPQRNRIISGLADAILVIEAKEKSGTLITVDMALEQGREVYALPGRATDLLSAGCNRLIKQGAGIVISPEDLLQELYQGITQTHETYEQQSLFLPDQKQNNLYQILDFQPQSVDVILQKYNAISVEPLSLQDVMYQLLQLCIKGVAKQVSGSCFTRSK